MTAVRTRSGAGAGRSVEALWTERVVPEGRTGGATENDVSAAAAAVESRGRVRREVTIPPHDPGPILSAALLTEEEAAAEEATAAARAVRDTRRTSARGRGRSRSATAGEDDERTRAAGA